MFPVDYSCFSKEKMPWGLGVDYANERYIGTKAGVRGWNDYVVLEGGIDNRIDYLIPLNNKKILSQKDYNNQGTFFWIKYWSQSGDAIKILNNIVVVFFCMFVMLIIGYFKKNSDDLKNKFNDFLASFNIFSLQLILWFFLTPQTIYGGDVAIVVFVSFISSFFLKNLYFEKFRTKITIVLLFLISISYFEVRNINRIYDDYFKDSNNLKFFPWIQISKNILGQDYYQVNVNNTTLNVQKKIIGRNVGLPDPCGNTPMICLPEDRKQCIKEIDQKYNYMFIKGNEALCVAHIRERLYY